MRRFFALLFLFAISLSSCAQREQPSPRALLDRILSAAPLGVGIIRDSALPASDPAYLDPLLFRALYARADGSDDREDIRAAALFLGSSSVEHRELAIFSCRGDDSAREVASLCRARAARIAEASEVEARILVYRTTVVLVALPEPEPIIRLLDRLLG